MVLEIIPRTFVQLSWLKIKSTTERKGIYQPASGIRCYSTCSHRSPLRLFVNTREHWKENLHRKYLWASDVFPKTADLFVSQTHLSLTKPTLRSQKAFKPLPPFNADAEWVLLHTLWNSHVEVKINVGPNIYIFSNMAILFMHKSPCMHKVYLHMVDQSSHLYLQNLHTSRVTACNNLQHFEMQNSPYSLTILVKEFSGSLTF